MTGKSDASRREIPLPPGSPSPWCRGWTWARLGVGWLTRCRIWRASLSLWSWVWVYRVFSVAVRSSCLEGLLSCLLLLQSQWGAMWEWSWIISTEQIPEWPPPDWGVESAGGLSLVCPGCWMPLSSPPRQTWTVALSRSCVATPSPTAAEPSLWPAWAQRSLGFTAAVPGTAMMTPGPGWRAKPFWSKSQVTTQTGKWS